jgi:hypothetical protein
VQCWLSQHVPRGGNEEDKERDKCGLEAVLNFTEAHSAYETVKSFFYAQCISKHDEQNILNFILLSPWLLV